MPPLALPRPSLLELPFVTPPKKSACACSSLRLPLRVGPRVGQSSHQSCSIMLAITTPTCSPELALPVVLVPMSPITLLMQVLTHVPTLVPTAQSGQHRMGQARGQDLG